MAGVKTRALALAGLAVMLPAPAAAQGHGGDPSPRTPLAAPDGPRKVAAPASCEGDGDPFSPDQVINGALDEELEGSYVFLPFEVPAGTTSLRIRYCFDEPETPTTQVEDHTLDLGLYEPRQDASEPWGPAEFRGWGGSSHPDVILSPQGFTSAAEYDADPKDQVPGRTTRAFLPGPISAGQWAVELGLASIVSQPTDIDGKVAYRVEIELSDDPAFAADPYAPAPYDSSPARSDRGWYAGDMHVHGEHSALGDAPMREVFDYAFGPLTEGEAGLDFITLSDYVSGSSWDEVGRFQGDYPDKLIIRSAEMITYEGHLNSHGNTAKVDYRYGPLLERQPSGDLVQLRGSRPPRKVFDRIEEAGGFGQINHPTIFPSPPFPAGLCRGCPWDYSGAQTDYSKVDAIEIATGPAGLDAPAQPGPNPFTVTGIEFWEEALAAGHKIAAVGSSDSHNAGRTPNPVTQAPIGTATTMVLAEELSTAGIQAGVEAGHTYVKITGNEAPDVRLSGSARGGEGPRAIMGDTLEGGPVDFTARVLGAEPAADPSTGAYLLVVLKDGNPVETVPVSNDDFTYEFSGSAPGRYGLQLQRGTTIEVLSNPIYVEAAQSDGSGGGGSGGGGGDTDDDGNGGGVGSDDDDQDEIDANDSFMTATVESAQATGSGSLPFTGLGLGGLAILGAGFLAAGYVLRRRATAS